MTDLAVTAAESETGTSIEAWEAPSRTPSTNAAPVLAVDGFDWLLEMARTQQLDLANLSILHWWTPSSRRSTRRWLGSKAEAPTSRAGATGW